MRTQDRSDPQGRVRAHRAAGTDTRRIAYPIGVRTVQVVGRELVTPRMLRLTVGGPGLDGLCTHEADDHVKIVLPDEDGTIRAPSPNEQLMLDWPRPMPPTREYTVRRFNPDQRRLDLDVVLHEHGLASSWLRSRAVGDELTIAGPPGATVVPHTFEHYVLVVDATALPAAARWLETAPPTADVDLVVEVLDASDLDYPLPTHPRLRLHPMVRGARSSLADAVRALPTRSGRTFVFAAGEADDLRELRRWVNGRHPASITGYWKRGRAHYDE